MVLISIDTAFFVSSFLSSSFSTILCTKALLARSVSAPYPAKSCNHTASFFFMKYKTCLLLGTTGRVERPAARSGGTEQAVGDRSGAAAKEKGEKQMGLVALKNTGSRHTTALSGL